MMNESADTGKTRIDFRNVPVYMCTFTFEFMYISTRFRAGYQYKNSEFLGLVSRLKTTTAVPKTRGLPHSFGDTENEFELAWRLYVVLPWQPCNLGSLFCVRRQRPPSVAIVLHSKLGDPREVL